MAAVAAPRVAPDTVNPGDIALVLDGARPQQRIPYGDARCRPVGRIDYQVIVAAIAGEYGEPEIIAYLEQYPYAAPLDNHTPAARRIMVRLTAHGEEMALVVILRTAVGANEIHAVEISALFGHGHTPRNGGIVTHGHTPHPCHRLRPVTHACGRLRRIGTKPRGEHLGQHHKVDMAHTTFRRRR